MQALTLALFGLGFTPEKVHKIQQFVLININSISAGLAMYLLIHLHVFIKRLKSH